MIFEVMDHLTKADLLPFINQDSINLPHEQHGALTKYKCLLDCITTATHDASTAYQQYIIDFSIHTVDGENVIAANSHLKTILHTFDLHNTISSHVIDCICSAHQ